MSALGMTREAKAQIEGFLRRVRRAEKAIHTRNFDHASVYLESLGRDMHGFLKDAAVVDPLPPRKQRKVE